MGTVTPSKFLSPDQPRSLQQPIEQQAREAFYAHYVSEGSRGWDFLIPYQLSASSPELLNRSIDAVSLAIIAQQRSSASIMSSAQEHLGVALRLLNRAISHTDLTSGNELLSAILLLDLFTKLTCPGPGDLAFWRGHLNGALALIDALGLHNLQDRVSLRILSRFSINSVTSCVASATTVPRQLGLVWAHVTSHMARGEDPKWKLTRYMIEYASFRASVREGRGSLQGQVNMARLFDQSLLQLSQQMPLTWQPVKRTHINAFGSGFEYLSYKDRHVTQCWNVLRLVRIMVNEFLLEHSVEEGREDVVGETPQQTIITLVDNIRSSVYQYAGGCCQLRTRNPKTRKSISAQDIHSQPAHSPKQVLDCYTLIFPLFVAGRSTPISADQKAAIVQSLRFIHMHFGIENASFAANTIENQPDKDPWQVFAMLGSYGFAA
ncbi:hypothetical protein N7468_002566 [Penicillium chermesinum]|uniref:Uncharacterized protein n=1 Tax=Penicillium chermesinum TaxID=63820 RepID=A0A9W9TYK6_9EURO|nr:uncharacterized protein N7468_002566 [Penicillium chermesinum]KAJ5247583.1 hypothetical protein N7468_002566 [Penicillium chermesinum]KAJ6145818.1 hypothetical protein N7470_009713 [Penicillium chermesinum]